MIFNKVYGVQRGSSGPTVLLDTDFATKDPSWIEYGYTSPFSYGSDGLSVPNRTSMGNNGSAVGNPRTGALDALGGGYIKIPLSKPAENWSLQSSITISSEFNTNQMGGGVIVLHTDTDDFIEVSIEDSQANSYSWYKRLFINSEKKIEYGASGTSYKTGTFTINLTYLNGTLKIQDPTGIAYVNNSYDVNVGKLVEVYIFFGDNAAQDANRAIPHSIIKNLKITAL